MPTSRSETPDIIEKSALIEWLCHMVKRRERQRQVPIPFVKYFNYLARQFKKDDVIANGDACWMNFITFSARTSMITERSFATRTSRL